MQAASFRFGTWVAESTSNGDNRYVTSASFLLKKKRNFCKIFKNFFLLHKNILM